MKTGKIEFPVKIFQTFVSRSEVNEKLEAHGMWQVHERAQMNVIDVEGMLQLKLDEDKLPVFSFVGKRPHRVEMKQVESQYVKSGFTHHGVASVLGAKWIGSNSQWNISYSIPKHQFTCHITNPSKVSLCPADYSPSPDSPALNDHDL